MGHQRDIREFERTWRRLAREGLCDVIYGAEFTRVFRAWICVGRPESMEDYILLGSSHPCKRVAYMCLN